MTASLSGTASRLMSDGSMTRGIPSFSPASNAFLQLPTMSDATNVFKSLKQRKKKKNLQTLTAFRMKQQQLTSSRVDDAQ